MDSSIQLSQPDGKAVYCRLHEKADGRRLLLYSYAPIEGLAHPESLQGAGPGAELRWHPLMGEWSVYAAHRQNRTFMPSIAEDPLAPTRAGGPLTEIEFDHFDIAVFQNRFSSLHPDADQTSIVPEGITSKPANGDCEVVVYSQEKDGNLGTLSHDRRRLLISAWIDRYQHHYANGAEFVMPFESRGAAVGVTLPHPHGQIYAFPFTPQTQVRAAKAFEEGYSLSRSVRGWTDYIVEEAGPLVAVVPPFARYPYEVWIVHREPIPGPWSLSEEAFDAYAHLLGNVTRRYDALFGETPTMMSLQATPKGYDDTFEFHTQFFCMMRAPGRLKYLASVEQATGVFTVDVMPEQAAKALREAL